VATADDDIDCDALQLASNTSAWWTQMSFIVGQFGA
jgi:hypothetical protein